MVTVADINKSFAEKGVHIELPLAENLEVKSIQILEKISLFDGVRVLLAVRFINEHGAEVSDLFYCEGGVKREQKRRVVEIRQPSKTTMLPLRDRITFKDDEEARVYITEAFCHLLKDKGFTRAEREGVDLYFVSEKTALFANVATRCGPEALRKANELADLRPRQGPTNDYGLVMPAIQESLGVPLRVQEAWLARNAETFSAHHTSLFGVDPRDPNMIYAFTLYPRARELLKYFAITSPQWPMIRDRYVQERAKKVEPDGS